MPFRFSRAAGFKGRSSGSPEVVKEGLLGVEEGALSQQDLGKSDTSNVRGEASGSSLGQG